MIKKISGVIRNEERIELSGYQNNMFNSDFVKRYVSILNPRLNPNH